MYDVMVVPIVSNILVQYIEKCALENDTDCEFDLVDIFDRTVE